MDLFDKCAEFTIAKEAEEGGYYPYFIPLTESEGTEASYQGHRLIMCGSNNYLGLTTHPKVRQAAKEAIESGEYEGSTTRAFPLSPSAARYPQFRTPPVLNCLTNTLFAIALVSLPFPHSSRNGISCQQSLLTLHPIWDIAIPHQLAG